MQIGTKIFLSLAVPILAAMALFGYLGERRGRAFTHEVLQRDGRAIARSVQVSVEYALRDQQIEDVHRIVDAMSGYERTLGVRIFDPAGVLSYQSSSLAGVPFDNATIREVLRHRQTVETGRRVGMEPVLAFTLPLSSPEGRPVGAVQVFQLESFLEEDARDFRNFIVSLSIVMILATGCTLLLVTRYSIVRPLTDLAQRFRQVGSGVPREPIPIRRSDEFGRLAQEFEAMCVRLEEAQRSLLDEQEERRLVEERLRRAEHLASLGRLTAGLAHEIGTPLNVIGGRADALRRKVEGNEPAERNLRIISEQIDRITRIVRSLLDFARAREPNFARTHLPGVLRKVADLLEERLEQAHVEIEWTVPTDLPPVTGDADQLHQVFLNLAVNAVDAMPAGGTLSVRAAPVEDRHPETGGEPRAYVRIELEDTGSGIVPEHLEKLFEPFFTTKEIGKGTGLGLAVSYGIVREHRGWIQMESEPGAGTRATIYLPVAEGDAAASASFGRVEAASGRLAGGEA